GLKALTAAPQDFIIRFQHGKDKAATLAAVKDCATYTFEAMTPSYFADLSGGTLAWRRTLKPFTSLLRHHGIPYRWRLNRSILVMKGEDKHEVYDLQGAQDLLPMLGLPQDAMQHTAPHDSTGPLHSWDPERVTAFVPRQPRQGSYAAAIT
ncbi:Hypothetical predicted protein, partial [Pelobates cultripes]